MDVSAGSGTDLPRAVGAALEEFVGRIRRRFGARVTALRLYGSYARGDWHADSDVDVLVVVEGLGRRERREAIDAATEVYFEHLVRIAPLVLSAAEHRTLVEREYLLASDLEHEGVPL